MLSPNDIVNNASVQIDSLENFIDSKLNSRWIEGQRTYPIKINDDHLPNFQERVYKLILKYRKIGWDISKDDNDIYWFTLPAAI